MTPHHGAATNNTTTSFLQQGSPESLRAPAQLNVGAAGVQGGSISVTNNVTINCASLLFYIVVPPSCSSPSMPSGSGAPSVFAIQALQGIVGKPLVVVRDVQNCNITSTNNIHINIAGDVVPGGEISMLALGFARSNYLKAAGGGSAHAPHSQTLPQPISVTEMLAESLDRGVTLVDALEQASTSEGSAEDSSAGADEEAATE